MCYHYHCDIYADDDDAFNASMAWHQLDAPNKIDHLFFWRVISAIIFCILCTITMMAFFRFVAFFFSHLPYQVPLCAILYKFLVY